MGAAGAVTAAPLARTRGATAEPPAESKVIVNAFASHCATSVTTAPASAVRFETVAPSAYVAPSSAFQPAKTWLSRAKAFAGSRVAAPYATASGVISPEPPFASNRTQYSFAVHCAATVRSFAGIVAGSAGDH